MMASIKNMFDGFLGRGDYSTAVPVMDGPLQPNELIDSAEVLFSSTDIDNLAMGAENLYYSSGNRLYQRSKAGETAEIKHFHAAITAIAVSKSGTVAVAVEGEGIQLLDKKGEPSKPSSLISKAPKKCITALAFMDETSLFAAQGSHKFTYAEWKFDLMSRGSHGSLWKLDLASGRSQQLIGHLKFPYGLHVVSENEVYFSESWAHRVSSLDLNTLKATPLLDNLPGYPARIQKKQDGGYLLALFAPRNQMVEFVLREKSYRQAMMMQVEEPFWIAPTLRSGDSFKEPLQGGAVKQMGILKPWAPAFSYGLVIALDSELNPQYSWHSRANGSRHGITSVCEWQGDLLAGAKGAHEVYRLPAQMLTSTPAMQTSEQTAIEKDR